MTNTTLDNETTETIQVDSTLMKEFHYMVMLHQTYGADYQVEGIHELINYILRSIADGSRRPGSWERQMLEQMGLVAHSDEHQYYRSSYGNADIPEHSS